MTTATKKPIDFRDLVPRKQLDFNDLVPKQKMRFDDLVPTETRPNLLTRTLKGLARKTVIEPIKAVETKSRAGGTGTLLDTYGLVRQFKQERGRSPTAREFDEILISGKEQSLKTTQDAYKWFDLPPAEGLSEKGVELVTGVTSFVTKLALTKKVLGGQSLATDVMSFEMVHEADGGTPGVGALLGYSLGAFGKMRAPTLARKGFRMAGQSATLAGFTAAAGGTTEDIVVAAMLPPVMNTVGMFPAMLKGKRADIRLTNEIRNRYPFMRDVPKDSTIKWARAMRDAGKVKAGEMTAKTWGKIHGNNLYRFSEQTKSAFSGYDKLKLPGVAQKGFKEALMRTYPKISSDVADKAIEIYNKKGLAEAGKYVSAASIIGDKIIPEPTIEEQERFDKDIADMDRELAAIQRGETPSTRAIPAPTEAVAGRKAAEEAEEIHPKAAEGEPEAVEVAPEAKAEAWQLTSTNQQAADLGFTRNDQAIFSMIEAEGGQVNLSSVPLEDWFTYQTPEGLAFQSDKEVIDRGGYSDLLRKAKEVLDLEETFAKPPTVAEPEAVGVAPEAPPKKITSGYPPTEFEFTGRWSIQERRARHITMPTVKGRQLKARKFKVPIYRSAEGEEILYMPAEIEITKHTKPPAKAEPDKLEKPVQADLRTDIFPIQEVPLRSLKLSKDVPQFKEKASHETGVIRGEELQGEYKRLGTGAIVVWQRKNGDMEVITGRHRLDLAKRTGQKTIPAQIVKEIDGFNREMALTLDAESNIRDNQGSIEDYVHYFKNTEITEEDARKEGLLSRVKGKKGFVIGKSAVDDVYAAFINGKISDSKAYAIAKNAPDNEYAQRVALLKANQLNPDELEQYTQILSRIKPSDKIKATQGNLFGYDESALIEAEAIAKEVSKEIDLIKDRLLAVKGALRRPETARKMGLEFSDEESIRKEVDKLENRLDDISRVSTNPELYNEMRKRAGLKEKQPREQPKTVKPAPAAPERGGTGISKPPDEITFAEPPRPEGPNILMLAEVEKRLDEKAMLKKDRKLSRGASRLAKQFIGKTDLRKMTEEELSKFGQIINKLPEPTYNNKGERIPPQIPKTTAITKAGEFEVGYKEPSIWKLLHAPEYYAEKLGIKSIVEKAEAGKIRFSLEFQQLSNKVDMWVKRIEKLGKTTVREKAGAKLKNLPTKAVARFRDLLDTHDEPPDSLNNQEKELFNNFRELSRWLLKRENEVRESLDIEPILYRKAYVRHVAEGTAKEILAGRYPFPQGRKFWAEQVIAKKIYNAMEMHRTLKEDLEEIFSRDLGFATKSMLWTALKEIHLSQPIRYLEQQLTARGKDTPVYKTLSPSEQRKWDKVTTIPARTRKWAREYVRTTFRGQQSDWDQDIEATVKKTGLNGLLNKYLERYGRALSHKPVSNFFTKMGRAQIMGVLGGPIGGRPRQIIRNKFQTLQNMALYPLYKETWRTYAPIRGLRNTTPDLERLLDKSLFLKAYTGTEEWPVDIKSKIAKASLRAYQWSATSNARQAMECAYWGMLPLFNNPKFKYYGWADPKRTYKEKPEFLYPSEEKLMFKEMEFGAAATQHNYTPIGMPEIFRHKTLTPLTRLQSWWMNHYFRFTEEALRRAFTGRPTYSKEGGPILPWKYRLGWLRYALIAVPILNMMRYERSYFFGAAPTGTPPFAQFAQGMYNYVVGKGADNDRQWKRGKKQMIESGKTFIPGYMSYKDFEAIWSGRKDLSSLFFYKKR